MQAIMDRVIIVLDEEETRTKSGLFLTPAPSDRQKCIWATVVSAGPKCKSIKDGDRILIDNYHHQLFEYGDKKYYGTKEEDILAIEELNNVR